MFIRLNQCLRPFSHLPATKTILPGSPYQLTLFPCALHIHSLASPHPILIEKVFLEFQGPIEQFTIWNDLEDAKVTVSGKTAQGWMRYHLFFYPQTNGIRLLLDRAPAEGVPVCSQNKSTTLFRQHYMDLIFSNENQDPFKAPKLDRLSFGNYKSQDIENIKKRLDLEEIFPIWHRLGQLVPQCYQTPQPSEGVGLLLQACREQLESKQPEKAKQKWLNFFQAGMRGLFAPQLEDDHALGLLPKETLTNLTVSPLFLLSESVSLIRNMFIKQIGNQIWILPHLLPELHKGHLTEVNVTQIGYLTLEWTKKTIRRCHLHATHTKEIEIIFCSHVRHYRLRTSFKDTGKKISTSSKMTIQENQDYFFDNFT